MPRFTSPFDGAQLFYRDYVPATYPPPFRPDPAYGGKDQPALVFLHGWPMSSLMFENLTLPLCETYRYRCIAPDRRGFGNSDWNGSEPTSGPIDHSVLAGDVSYLLKKLNVGPFVFVAASMGPGESVQAYIESEYVREYCKGFFWIGAALPFPISNPDAPSAPSREVWDGMLDGFRNSRASYVREALPGSLDIYGECRIPEETMQRYLRLVLTADAIAIERCVQLISTTDFTSKLRRIGAESNVPITCIHGDKDIGMPIESSAEVIKKIIPRTTVKTYENGAHGLYETHTQQILADMLEFVGRLDMSTDC